MLGQAIVVDLHLRLRQRLVGICDEAIRDKVAELLRCGRVWIRSILGEVSVFDAQPPEVKQALLKQAAGCVGEPDLPSVLDLQVMNRGTEIITTRGCSACIGLGRRKYV